MLRRRFSAVRGPNRGRRGQPSVPGGGLEFRQRIHAQRLVNLPDAGHAESGNAEHVRQAGRNLLPQVLQHAGPAGLHQFGDDSEGGRPDAAGRGEGTIRQRDIEVHREALDGPGRVGERADAECAFLLELEQGGDLLQDVGRPPFVHQASCPAFEQPGGQFEQLLTAGDGVQPRGGSSREHGGEERLAARARQSRRRTARRLDHGEAGPLGVHAEDAQHPKQGGGGENEDPVQRLVRPVLKPGPDGSFRHLE